MDDDAWNAGFVKCLGCRLAGDLIGDVDEKGEPLVGETLLLLLNAHHEPLPFVLPVTNPGHYWERMLDTAEPEVDPARFDARQQYPLQERSMVVLRVREVEEEAVPPVTPRQAEILRKEAQRPPVPVPPSDKPFVR
jgi:isoamylase